MSPNQISALIPDATLPTPVVPGVAGRCVVVAGLARSGLATIRALKAGGARVIAWDDNQPARMAGAEAGAEVLAPAEVSASDPATVASPLDGVVQAIEVQPNQRVEAGDLLLTLDPTNLQAEVAVARRTLEIAEAELRRARQGAFNDRDAGAQIALLEARARLRQAELEYAEQRLARVEVRAERPGIVLFTRADDWIGRPVQTGQRIMTIADPSRAEIRVELPVGEAIRLEPGAPVQLFLDARPLEPVAGRMTSLSYTAEQTPGGILAYELKARLDQKAGEALPRVGLRGTAKVYGADVPLAFYLFRRPLAALRQHTGF